MDFEFSVLLPEECHVPVIWLIVCASLYVTITLPLLPLRSVGPNVRHLIVSPNVVVVESHIVFERKTCAFHLLVQATLSLRRSYISSVLPFQVNVITM